MSQRPEWTFGKPHSRPRLDLVLYDVDGREHKVSVRDPALGMTYAATDRLLAVAEEFKLLRNGAEGLEGPDEPRLSTRKFLFFMQSWIRAYDPEVFTVELLESLSPEVVRNLFEALQQRRNEGRENGGAPPPSPTSGAAAPEPSNPATALVTASELPASPE